MPPEKTYPIYRYNDIYRLKVPPLLWLVMVYGLRHLAAFASQIVQSAGGDWAEFMHDWRFLITDALILAVMFSTGFRIPSAHTLMRKLWQSGRKILLAAYILDLALFAAVHQSDLGFSGYDFPTVAGILMIDLLVITYLARSRLVRDVFADFPEPADRTVHKTQA